MKNTFAIMAAIVVASSAAQAGIVFTSVQMQETAPILQNTFGQLRMALNFGNGGPLIRDGISFANLNVTSGTGSITFVTTPFLTVGSTTTDWRQANLGGGDALFFTEAYTATSAALSLTVSGLNPASLYQFQFLHGDPRPSSGNNGGYNNGLIVATDSWGNTNSANLTFGNPGPDFAVVTAQVWNSTSFTYSMPNAGRGPSVAGLTVFQAVPEPGTWGAAALLTFGAAFMRRRKCAQLA